MKKYFSYQQFIKNCFLLVVLSLAVCLTSCKEKEEKETSALHTITIYQTSQEEGYLKRLDSLAVTVSQELNKNTIQLLPENQFQEYYGFGASFTESSAWNLATIPTKLRKEVLTKIFSPTQGAGFSLTRTHINSSDYSNTHYTYVDDGDEDLTTFSIKEDLKGFTGEENEQVKGVELVDSTYDLIPMIKEASAIAGADFKIIASPWSPPSWMKTGETATMTNGSIMPKYYKTWAKYLSKYITAYQEQGIDIWALTPQNEPLHNHDARWDSNGFTAEQGREFLRDYLGPQLVKDGHLNVEDLEEGLRVLLYDHNKEFMLDYVAPTYNDPEAAKYAWGTGFHWYANSELEKNNYFAEALDTLRNNWPNKAIIHTESSIDIDANEPIKQYWRESTDYAGTFLPFKTYAYDIITDLNHGVQGYVEWCMILSNEGKPNPYDNFNSAPVLINPETDEIIYTPLYYLLSHFSKFIRPGAHRIGSTANVADGIIYTAAKNTDGSISLVMFNANQTAQTFSITLEENIYSTNIAPNAMQTLVFEPTK